MKYKDKTEYLRPAISSSRGGDWEELGIVKSNHITFYLRSVLHSTFGWVKNIGG
ncbi:hypothetical protein OAD26_00445 [bacterium]|nr:hypothetical protein [bacterium]